MKYSYRDILDSLPVKKNSNSSWWVKLWVRKISFLFTFIFINLGFSPNGVSVISIFVALFSFICFAVPTTWTLVLAIISINLWLILDCVDGNIARCRKQKTVYGEFVDDIGGYYVVAFVYLAIAIRAYNDGGVLLNNTNWIIVVGAISCISDILARLINKDYGNFSMKRSDYVQTDYTNESKKSLSYVRRRIGKEVGISGAFMPLTIVSAIFSAYDLMTIFYCAFNVFALVSTTMIYIYKADKYDKEHSKNE
ncbi:MAG: CDP-alcohol phosphatidyltransferase family protein [Clostridiales bacterium]|nr:CDP-alcohol phosphatidyltransferase family protein [Clostridiales bacterium]